MYKPLFVAVDLLANHHRIPSFIVLSFSFSLSLSYSLSSHDIPSLHLPTSSIPSSSSLFPLRLLLRLTSCFAYPYRLNTWL